MITKLIWRFLSFLYHFTQGLTPDVNIGIAPEVRTLASTFPMSTRRHGYVRGICLETKKTITLSILVDKPRFLFMPSKGAIKRLLDQLTKIGVAPSVLVIEGSKKPKVYQAAQYV